MQVILIVSYVLMKQSLYIAFVVLMASCVQSPQILRDTIGGQSSCSFVVKLSADQHVTIIPDVEKLGDIRRHWTRYTVLDFEKDVRRAVAAADHRLTVSEIKNLVFRTLYIHPLGKGPGGPIPFRIGDYSTVQIISPPQSEG